MGRPKGTDNQVRERLADAAGKAFRASGYGGAGIDGLAQAAGLTSGAFYSHFGSKSEAFRVAVAEGVRALMCGIQQHQETHGRQWLEPFVDFYLGPRMEVGLQEACAVPTLSGDVARADTATRELYSAEMANVAQALARGFRGERAAERAWELLALLVGAATMARAVSDGAQREAILRAAASAAKRV